MYSVCVAAVWTERTHFNLTPGGQANRNRTSYDALKISQKSTFMGAKIATYLVFPAKIPSIKAYRKALLYWILMWTIRSQIIPTWPDLPCKESSVFYPWRSPLNCPEAVQLD